MSRSQNPLRFSVIFALLLVWPHLAVAGSASPAQGPLTILYSANNLGETEPGG